MAVYVTGDYHGGVAEHWRLEEPEWPEGYSLTRDDVLIVAGDFGLPWTFSLDECEEIAWLESRPWTTVFVDGNHERFDHWAERPCEEWRGGLVQRLSPGSPIRHLVRGEVYDLGGASVLAMGGATSVDRARRVEGVSWWPQELPDAVDFARADAALSHSTPRTSSTQTAPRRIASEKHTVRRMDVGTARSHITTCMPARKRRSAMPEAMSPAPRITTSIVRIPPRQRYIFKNITLNPHHLIPLSEYSLQKVCPGERRRRRCPTAPGRLDSRGADGRVRGPLRWGMYTAHTGYVHLAA